MKLRLFVLIAALTLFITPTIAAAGGGRIDQIKGDVWTTQPGGSEKSAHVGAPVKPGTRIRTGKKSEAKITFEDGSVLKVSPGSSLLLSGNKRHKKKKTSVVLFFGRIWSKVTRSIAGDRKYEITTPNAVCGVRGTEFETAVADDGSVRVRVTEGSVGVGVDGDDSSPAVGAGDEIEADEEGVGESYTAEEKAKWAMWEKRKRERLRKNGRSIVDKIKAKIMSRKGRLEAMRSQQKQIESKRKSAENRARAGDSGAIAEIKKYNQQLAEIADGIADIGDATESQFAIVDHFADLASDPRFGSIDRKYLEAEAASLRRIKASLDKLVSEGTDISMKAMDKMLDDMGKGQRGSLKDKGSAADDLFGGDDMDMGLK